MLLAERERERETEKTFLVNKPKLIIMENKQPDVQCQHVDLAHGTSIEEHLCLLIALECAVLLSS